MDTHCKYNKLIFMYPLKTYVFHTKADILSLTFAPTPAAASYGINIGTRQITNQKATLISKLLRRAPKV